MRVILTFFLGYFFRFNMLLRRNSEQIDNDYFSENRIAAPAG
jgi:hypothetical protein